MVTGPVPSEPVATAAELDLLRRQLDRERRARRTAETVGESATAELWRSVADLRAAHAQLEAKAEQAELSQRLMGEVRRDLDLQQLMATATAAVGEALDVDRCLIRLADEGSLGLITSQWCGPGILHLSGETRLPAGLERLALQTSRDHEILWIDDVAGDPRLGPADSALVLERLGCLSYAGAPMHAGPHLVGWLVLQSTRVQRDWSARDRGILTTVAHDLGGAMLQAVARQQQTDTVRQLETLDAAKSEFVSRVSHEVRTPLTSITGYVELLTEETYGPVTVEQAKILDVVRRNCERIMAMVDNLLVLSRADGSETPVPHVEVDVAAVVADVHLAVAPLLATGDVELLVSPVPPVASFRGNPQDIERVLFNLLSNAVKFSQRGGQVGLTTTTSARSLVFRVSDHGIGISADDQEQLFRRFFRSRNAIERAVPGTGLGLSLVKSIVEAHAGTIEVESAVDVGTTFTVTLPLSGGGGRPGP